MAGTQGKNLEAEPKAEYTKECYLLVYSSGLLSYISYIGPVHHSDMAPVRINWTILY